MKEPHYECKQCHKKLSFLRKIAITKHSKIRLTFYCLHCDTKFQVTVHGKEWSKLKPLISETKKEIGRFISRINAEYNLI